MKYLIDFLGLKKPVTIRVLPKHKKSTDAIYESEYNSKGKLCGHRITVYAKDTYRDFDTLIAHELIHAWQEEKGLTEIHGKRFRKMAAKMQSQFPQFHELYIPEVDKP